MNARQRRKLLRDLRRRLPVGTLVYRLGNPGCVMRVTAVQTWGWVCTTDVEENGAGRHTTRWHQGHRLRVAQGPWALRGALRKG